MDQHASPLSGIVGRLESARNRIRLQQVVNAAIWAATAGLASLAVVEFVRRALPGVWHAAFGTAGTELAWWIAAGIAVAAVAVGVIAALSRTPDIAGLAQRADHRFGLAERLSTALEAERQADGRPASSVIAALIDDAASRGRAVDAQLLAPFRLPRGAWALPAAAVVALLVVAAVPQLGLPATPDTLAAAADTETTFTDAERVETAQTIQRVADLVQEQAERRSDPYMAAVANTLRDLGQRVAAGPATTRAEVMDELAALSNYAAQASSAYRTDQERVPQLLDALSRSIAATQPNAALAESGQPQPGTEQAGAESSAAPGGAGSSEDRGNIEDMLAELEGGADGAAGDPGATGERASVSGDYLEAAAAQNRARAAEAAENADGAQLIGPSSNAQAGDSLLAGEGTDALGDEPVQPVQVEFEKSRELALKADDTGEGLRLELEIAPEARLTEINQQSLGEAAAGWERAPEAAVSRPNIGFEDRDSVSRFLHALKTPAAQ